MKNIVYAVDTSGGIRGEWFNSLKRNLVLKYFGQKEAFTLHFIMFDTNVYPFVFNNNNIESLKNLSLDGWGGTQMDMLFQYIKDIEVDELAVVTDGYLLDEDMKRIADYRDKASVVLWDNPYLIPRFTKEFSIKMTMFDQWSWNIIATSKNIEISI